MTTYITLIIASLLGILGLISKTKTDEKSRLINKLTPFGYIVLILIIITGVISFFSQREKDRKSKQEKEDITKKATRDSIIQENHFLKISYAQTKTISSLNEQKKRDSTKIKQDSLRFLLTLYNFKEQLNRQEKTLENIEEILHPLFPMKIEGDIKVTLGEKSIEIIKKYLKELDSQIELKGGMGKMPYGQVEFWDEGISYFHYRPSDTCLYEKAFEELNAYLFQKIFPQIDLNFYQNDISERNDWNSSLALKSYEQDENVFILPITFDCRYDVDLEKNSIQFTFSFEPLYNRKPSKTMNSIYSCKDGFLEITLQYIDFDASIKPFLTDIKFLCGINFTESYSASFDTNDYNKETDTYLKWIKDLLR
jgi:hypothetical protein